MITLALCIPDDMSSNRHATITCPIELLHTYTSGTLTSADGLTSCNITVDICTETSNVQISYDRTCHDALKVAGNTVYTSLKCNFINLLTYYYEYMYIKLLFKQNYYYFLTVTDSSTCLLYFSNDTADVTYLHVWNNDDTLGTNVGRINCYVSFDSFLYILIPFIDVFFKTPLALYSMCISCFASWV